MRVSRTASRLAAAIPAAVIVFTTLATLAQGPPPQAPAPVDVRIWLGRAAEFEEYLRTVQMVKFEDLSVGVTKPKKAHLPPGGLVPYVAWKMLPPGIYNGFWESYQSEIAAYELDKLLELNMIPPTVEKKYRGEAGAAVMWVSQTKSFTDLGGAAAVKPPAEKLDHWNRQVVRAKMFDNLIANIDPNQGNWLVDSSWNLVLIDHTRSFTNRREMVHEMTRVDAALWERMKALTEAQLKPVLGKFMGGGEIRAIIQRRDRMQQVIDALVKAKGADAVFIK
jgi:hypothetical protein